MCVRLVAFVSHIYSRLRSKTGSPCEAMENTLVNHASLFKTLLFTDKFCHIFATVSTATRVNNLEEFRLAKLAFDNLLEVQADKHYREHQDDGLDQFMDDQSMSSETS